MSIWQKMLNALAEKAPIIKTGRVKSQTIGPFIFRGTDWDEGTKVHEQTHVKQLLKDPFMNLRYAFDKSYKWKMEKEAIQNQIDYYAKTGFQPDWEYIQNRILTEYNGMASVTDINIFIEQMKIRYEAERV